MSRVATSGTLKKAPEAVTIEEPQEEETKEAEPVKATTTKKTTRKTPSK